MVSTIPAGFICPITQEVMKDPVICCDGHSYERNAIMRWLQNNNTSPMTNLIMDDTTMYPNISLRQNIEEYVNNAQLNQTTSSTTLLPKCNVVVEKHNNMLSVTCEDAMVKNNVDFVFAIDNSGSMGESAGIQGDVETQCYSRLDLVKHAALCIIQSLGPNDTIGIVLYSSNARVLMQRSSMTVQNKNTAISLIKNIGLEGATNLWDGLQTSLTLSERSSHAKPVVLLFTDGQPTAGDQQVDRAFSRYLSSNKLKSSVYTFGFSNDVNSTLLNTLSLQGNGQFHFISDSAMIFTTIVNFLSNYFTNYGDIIIDNINYGPLYYGQTKYIDAGNNVQNVSINDESYIVANSNNPFVHGDAISIAHNMIQQSMIELNTRNFSQAQQIINNCLSTIRNLNNNSQLIQELLENISDQLFMAASEQYYNKWGKHYMYSFLNALKHQINNNFKDKVVQNFGGTMFYQLQDELNNIVANVSPPPPSRTYQGQTYTVQSMSSFNNRSNPCFSGYNKVKMAYDDSFKYVKDIKRGDHVWTPCGVTTVKLVVKTLCKDNLTDLCKVGNLTVTPWHPIKYEDNWCFPDTLAPARLSQCEAVYSFVLDKYHIMNIENFDVICLAHGYTDGVLAHEFWGTQKIINNLKSKEGFDDGLVVLKAGCLMNDPKTGLVCAL